MKKFTKKESNIAKGIAICLLLFYHLFSGQANAGDLNIRLLFIPQDMFSLMADFGKSCVAVFVFITSFGISKGMFSDTSVSLMDGYKKALSRLWKLAGNFFIMFLSVNAAFGAFFSYSATYGDGKQAAVLAIVDALGLSDAFGTPTLNQTWWYMSFAYLLIVLVPAVAAFADKAGWAALILAAILPGYVNCGIGLDRYLFSVVLGICAAKYNIPDRLMNMKLKKFIQWIIGIALWGFLIILRGNYVISEYLFAQMEAVIALYIVFIAGNLFSPVPVLNSIFEFIGKHSLNVFLVHNIFLALFFRKYIYITGNVAVTFLTLLCVSLLYSCVIELIKKGIKQLVCKKNGDRI